MNTSSLVHQLRRLFSRKKSLHQKPQRERHLRLMQLEDRRVLNASFALTPGVDLVLNDFDAGDGGLTISMQNVMIDTVATDAYVFELDANTWDGDPLLAGDGIEVVGTQLRIAQSLFDTPIGDNTDIVIDDDLAVDPAVTLATNVETFGGDFTATGIASFSGATFNLTTSGNDTDEASGAVTITAVNDITFTTGDIITAGVADNGVGGDVNLTTDDGDIVVDHINADGFGTGAGGNISLTANDAPVLDTVPNGSVTLNGVVQTNNDATVTLDADNSVQINANLTALGTGAVSVTANADLVTDGGAETLTMGAGTVIDAGSGTILLTNDNDDASGDDDFGGDITAHTLVTTNNTATAIVINSDAGVQLNHSITTSGGGVDIDADDNITSAVDGAITTTGDIANEDSGDVTMDAGGNISLAGHIHTTGFDNAASADDSDAGNITLTTVNGNITTLAGATLNAVGGDNNDGDALANGAGGIIALNAGGTVSIGDAINAGMTDLNIDGTGAVNLGANLTALQVTVTSTGGSISRTAGTVSGTAAILNAANGIGSAASIQTAVSNLQFNNTTNATNINNAGALTINGASSFGSGGGSVSAGSPLTIAAAVTSAGDFILEAAGDGATNGTVDVLTINANVTHTGLAGVAKSIILRADDDVIFQGGLVSFANTNAGDILTVQADSAAVPTPDANLNGDIQFSGGSVNVGSGTASFSTNTAAGGGAVLGNVAAGTDITAATIDLDAGAGIGAAATLEITGTTVTADTTNGGIDIDSLATGLVTAGSLTTGTGTIQFDQTGNQILNVTTAATSNGAVVISNAGASLNATTVTAGGAGQNVALTTTTAGNVTVGNITAAGDQVQITSAAAIEELAVADASADITAATIDLDAVTGIGAAATLEITGTTVTADTTNGGIDIDSLATGLVTAGSLTTGTGTIQFDQTGNQILNVTTAATSNGAVVISNAGASLNATTVTAGGAGQNVALTTTTAGNVTVGNITAAGDQVQITSAAAIEELAVADASADITAATIDLDAVTGIGAAATLEITGTTVTADTTNGGIDIDSLATGLVTAGSLTTGTGTIQFDQTGNQILNVTTAATSNGAVVISNAGASLNATTVTAGGAGQNVALTTTTAGNVTVGNITAAGDQVQITSAAAIEELAVADASADITAATIDLDAVTGIGAAATLEITGTTVTADTTNGGIDIDSLATGLVTAGSLTTGTGTIQFDQTGNQILNVTTAATSNGAVVISNAGASLNATTVTAGGAGQNVALTTTTAGNVTVGNITAAGDQVQITSAAAIEELAVADASADITAATIDLDAVTGIGAAATLEITGTTVTADTTNGGIDIDSLATGLVTAGSLTTGTGTIQFDQTGNQILNVTTAATSNGAVVISNAGASLNATTVTAGGAGQNVALTTTTAGNVTVGNITAAGDQVQITSAAAIEELAVADASADITAATIDLDAVTGIGAAATLEITGTTVTADTTNGGIDIDSLATGLVTAGSLTTGTGTIQFDQTGNQILNVTTATTSNGAVVISNAGASLNATTVTAGGAGQNVALTTTTAGNVTVGNITAAGDQVQITSAAAIEELAVADASADITAATIDLDAVTGIGAAATLEITGTTVTADTTNGGIDIDSLATGLVTAGSLTTGTGTIQFDQTGNQILNVTTATTSNGAVVISNAGASLNATTVTAGGAGQNVTLTTTTAGDVGVGAASMGAVATSGGQILITAAGQINSVQGSTISTTDTVSGLASGTVTLTAASSVNLDGNVVTAGADGTPGLNAGAVNITGTNVAVTNIDASGGDATGGSGGNGGDAAAIILDATAGSISLAGALDSSGGAGDGAGVAGNGQTFAVTDPVVLEADSSVSTNGTVSGNIIFGSTVNGTSAGGQNLTLTAGGGDVTLTGVVGGGTRVGDVTINSANNVTANAITAASLTQLAGTGTTTLNGAVDTNTVTGISIQTDVDITVHGDLIAIDPAANTDESIALRAGNDVTFMPTVTRVTTRDEIDINTGDTITINADTDGIGGGTVTFPAAAGFDILTDGGIANTFTARPPLLGPPAAFFLQSANPFAATTANATTDQLNFLSEYTVLIGNSGEENLRIDIDWRDPFSPGGMTGTTSTGNPITSDRLQTLYVNGNTVQVIGHNYTSLDFQQFVTAGVPLFDVDFSVSHHDSIQVTGPMVTQSITQNVVNGLISSSDDPGTGTGVLNPGTNVTNLAASNIDLHFETGLLRVVVPTILVFTPDPEAPPPEPPAAPVPAAPPEPVPFLTVSPVEPPETPLTSYSSQSEDYFQLRRTQTNEPVEGYEHIDDDIGWKLLQPRVLKKWIQQEKNLNGAGYELWLITTKGKNGQDVTFERPVLKFDIFDQQPFPMEEDLGEELPELRLERLDVDEDGNIIDGDPKADTDAATDGGSPDQLPNPPNDDADQARLPPMSEPVPVSRVDDTDDYLIRSTMAGLAVSSVLAGKHRPQGHSRQSSLVARLMQRINGQESTNE